MTRLEGSVTVQSDGLHGTTFILKLPLAKTKGGRVAEKKSFRAIVIEDDSSWQQILSEILTDCGLAVDVAGNLETRNRS
jgi:hypothetical protein